MKAKPVVSAERALGAVILILGVSSRSLAVTDEEIFRRQRFNLTNPGGRALAMAGASVATAEDATAPVANPAALARVPELQAFGEIRSLRAEDRVSQSRQGSLSVDTDSGERKLPYLGVRSVSSTDSETKPAYLAVAWPLSLGGSTRRLTLAASRQVLLSQDLSLQRGSERSELRVAFDSFPNTVGSDGKVKAYSVSGPVTGSGSSEIVSYGVSAGIEVHPDFSLGATASYATLDISADSLTRVEDPLGLFLDPTNPRFPTQPTSDVHRSEIDGSDHASSWAVGVLWHPDALFASGESPVRFGAAFRRGARFTIHERTFTNGNAGAEFDTDLVVPDRYSVGAAFAPDPHWTISLEVERVEYSDMLKGFRPGVNFLTSHAISQFYDVAPHGAIHYTADDVTVPRLGAEYALPLPGAGRRLLLQAGYFHQPDGSLRMTSFNSKDPKVNRVYLNAFGRGEAENHVTAGAGLLIGRSSIQLAGQFSGDDTQVVFSYGYSFARK